MRFLLDTNIVSHIIRHPRGPAAQHFRELSSGAAFTSIIVAAEARFGALKKSAARLSGRLEELFEQIEIVPFEGPADLRYAELRVDLERRGKLIGSNDMLIAAHALALDCTLVTANEREFRRVSGLRVENWLA
jgi:tRNA(fMet)-specific endonuclease VapC